MYFSKRLLMYETNSSNDTNLDYGEVSQVITDKLINVNMGGSNYTLEAVSVANGYIPKVGDWVVIDWKNGNPIAKGSNESVGGYGLNDINAPVVVAQSDLASGTINSDHIRSESIEARHIQAGSITADSISANTITSDKIKANTITGDNISANTITGDKIQSNTITSDNIRVGGINGTSISANSISSVQLQANSVTAVQISANSVQTQHISANSITSQMIKSDAINSTHISANSITSDEIQTNAVQASHISANQVNASHISSNAVQTQHISANTITTSQIKTGAITANLISANQVNASHISANSVTATAISANSVQTQHISANTITTSQIKAGAITTDLLSANSITTDKVQAGSITSNLITSNAINAIHINANAVQTQHISANTIISSQIQSNQINANHISANSIQTQHISANTITTNQIKAGAITADLITANAIQSQHISANVITGDMIQGGTITGINITANAIQTQHISSNTIVSNQIQANAINATHITANAITSTQVSANAIQAQHISSNSIQSRHISANSITTNMIQAGAITSNLITSNAITSQMIQANAIQSFQISANAVTSTQISANAVQAQHISANSIQTQHISANTITSNMIKTGAINSTLITANAITSYQISSNAIQGYHISANSISGNHIVAGTIQTYHISANSITSSLIQANAINATHISANAVTAGAISSNSIQSRHISANSIQANMISANQVNATHISANSVLSNMISANQVQAQHISANSIQTQHVSANTIMGYQINANQISGNHIVAGSISTDHLAVGTVQQGLLGQYYTYTGGANKFQIFKGSQIDPTINFSWGTGSPSIVGQSDNFSVRWQGFIQAPESGQYSFISINDDTMRVVVNNTQVINATYASGNEVTGNAISLTANNWYPILVEMSEGTGGATAILKWLRPSLTKEVIPAKYLSQGNTVIDGAQIITGTITASSMQVGTITASSGIIANAAITTANIASGNITSALIGTGEIKTANIATGNITNALIKDATIDHTKIASVDADTITVGHLDGTMITAGTISGGAIMAQTITGDRIKAGDIDTTQLKAGAVITSTLAAGAVTTDKIEAGAVTGDVIRAGSITAEHISTIGLDAQLVQVYNSKTGETLVGSGYLRVDGLDVGVVQSDNLLQNGLFLTSSSDYGYKRMNPTGEALLGNTTTGIGSHQVWKIDLTSGNIVKTIDIPAKKPFDIAIHPSGNYAYITVQGDDTLVQLDLAQDLLTNNTKKMGMGPARAKFVGEALEDHKHVFVLNTDPDDMNIPDSLIVVDTPPSSVNGDLYIHHEIALGNNPYDLVVDDDMFTYITMASQGDIVVVDSSGHDSHIWKVKGRIPITAFGTDNNHADLPSTFGLQEVTGGDSSGQFNNGSMSASMSGMGGMDAPNGYGTSDGSLKTYTPHGITQSSDPNTLYVVDYANGELVVVDKYGNAPYNALIGTTATGSFQGSADTSGNMGSGSTNMTTSSTSPASLTTEANGGGPGNYYVRYRIPVGDSPDFIELVNGKLFITLGSGDIAVVDEQQILNEISADNTYYGNVLPDGSYTNWNVFQPMRTVNPFMVRTISNVGISPSLMKVLGNNIYVSLSGQAQMAVIDTVNETVTKHINVGTNPKGFDFTPDGKYMYVANYGGVGDLSFIYPQGTYIGDPFMALEGGIMYQGADGWTPDRSNWIYDISGNIQSKATVEFHINEPLKNEGGYAKLTAFGIDSQYAQIEQDIINVENYSNGNNVVVVTGGRLVGNLDNTVWAPREGSFISGTVHNVKIGSIVSGNTVLSSANASKYSISYSLNQITFSANAVASGNWVQADYTAPNNLYFKTHNSSLEIAVDNGSSQNFNTSFQVDEFVPNFVSVDNRQTSSFTPTADGISDTYEGLEYSVMTNRALNIPSGNITSNCGLANSTRLVDGDLTSSNYSLGASVSGGAYVKLDLGATYMIGMINVWHYYSDGRTYHNTKTEVSEDGTHWTTVFNSAVSGEYAETSDGHMIMFDAMPVRYIRDWSNGSTANTGNHWVEIQAFGDWEVEKGYTYPSNSMQAGQQVATNGIGFVSTDISKAYIAMNIQINFTSWWWMTYIVGPEFGRIRIEMPTLMNSGHFLNQQAPIINNVAHRHIMSFPPSAMVMQDDMNGIEGGKHRVIIRQDSGKVTLDRLRFDDFQYYTRSTLAIPSNTSSATFTRYKVLAEQAKWYQGQGRQSTEGAYDTPRTNPDTGLRDYSVPIKYRVRVLSQLSPTGNTAEAGTVYVTSAIFETGKQSTHWRRSEASDVFAGNKIETWNPSQPMNTGIQSAHLANGAVRSSKILPNAIFDYHISNYARIQEHKLELNYPTHQHGYYTVEAGAGPMGTDLHIFNDNLSVLDTIQGWAGTSGNYGTGNIIARGDHKHDYLPLSGGVTVTGSTTFNSGVVSKAESHFSNGTYNDPAIGSSYGLKVSQGIATDKLNVNGSVTITGNIAVTGTVDGVDVSNLNSSYSTTSGNVSNHIGSGGTAHPIATSGSAGFMSTADRVKLDAIQSSAINQTTGDGRYLQLTGGNLTNTLNTKSVYTNGNITVTGNIVVTGTVDGVDVSVLSSNVSTLSGNIATVSGNLNTTNTNISTLSGNVATISGNLNTTNSNLSSLSGNVATISGNLNTTNSNLANLSGNIATVSGNLNTTNTNLSVLSGNIATVSGNLNTTNSNVSTLNGNIATVSGNLNTTNSNVSTISGNLNNHIGSGGSAHAVVTTSSNGFMSYTDKSKLDGISANAINQAYADNRYFIQNQNMNLGAYTLSFNANTTGGTAGIASTDYGSIYGEHDVNTDNSRLVIDISDNSNDAIVLRTHTTSSSPKNSLVVSYGGIVFSDVPTVSGNGTLATQPWVTGNYYTKSYLDSILVDATESVHGFMSTSDKIKLDNIESSSVSQSTTDGLYLKLTGGALSGGLSVTGNITLTGTVDGVDISSLNTSFGTVSANVTNHIGSGGSAHAVVTTLSNGFMSSTDKSKLDGIQSSAINQTSADARYLQLAGGALSGGLTVTGNIAVTGTVDGVDVSGLSSSFATVSANVTNHIGSGGSAHAVVTTSSNGFMSSTDKSKLDGISANAINQTYADGRYYIKNQSVVVSTDNAMVGVDTGAQKFGLYKKSGYSPALAITSGNTFNLYEMNTADLSTNISGTSIMNTLLSVNSSNISYKGNNVWHKGNLIDPATQTWISGNYYNSQSIDNKLAVKGDVFASGNNTLTSLNTFTNAGMSIKIQPSSSVGNTTKLLQMNNAGGTEIFSVNYSGGVTIAGDFTVTGQQVVSGTTSVNGDYTISGQLSVGGNSTLGDASTDTTTVNGTLRVSGNIEQIGAYDEVHRRPLYGIAGDLQFQTDSTSFDTIVDFYDLSSYALPTVQTGATRYYRLYVVYGDDITSTQASAGQKTTIRIAGGTNKDLDLPYTWGTANGRRDWYSAYFTDLPTGNGTIQAMLAQSGNSLGIRWIEVIAYDKF